MEEIDNNYYLLLDLQKKQICYWNIMDEDVVAWKKNLCREKSHDGSNFVE